MNKKELRLLVSGKVQGVGFRARTQSLAKRLEITGYVRNLDNGKVELVIQGDKEKIDLFLIQLKKDSEPHSIDHLEMEWTEVSCSFPSFKIV